MSVLHRVAVVFFLPLTAAVVWAAPPPERLGRGQPSIEDTTIVKDTQENKDNSALLGKVAPAIAQVTVTFGTVVIEGTGVLIDRGDEKGEFVLTCFHVAQPEASDAIRKVSFGHNGTNAVPRGQRKSYDAELVSGLESKTADLCLLKLKTATKTGLVPLPLATKSLLETNSFLIIGNPSLKHNYLSLFGKVSKVHTFANLQEWAKDTRPVNPLRPGAPDTGSEPLIYTLAGVGGDEDGVSNGFSGAPVINTDGRIAGLFPGKFHEEGGKRYPVAVSAHEIRRVLNGRASALNLPAIPQARKALTKTEEPVESGPNKGTTAEQIEKERQRERRELDPPEAAPTLEQLEKKLQQLEKQRESQRPQPVEKPVPTDPPPYPAPKPATAFLNPPRPSQTASTAPKQPVTAYLNPPQRLSHTVGLLNAPPGWRVDGLFSTAGGIKLANGPAHYFGPAKKAFLGDGAWAGSEDGMSVGNLEYGVWFTAPGAVALRETRDLRTDALYQEITLAGETAPSVRVVSWEVSRSLESYTNSQVAQDEFIALAIATRRTVLGLSLTGIPAPERSENLIKVRHALGGKDDDWTQIYTGPRCANQPQDLSMMYSYRCYAAADPKVDRSWLVLNVLHGDTYTVAFFEFPTSDLATVEGRSRHADKAMALFTLKVARR